jgi:cell division protein FtsL
MRILLYIVGIVSFLLLAGLSYSQNYATRDTLTQIEQIKSDIVQKQKELYALQDEWSYLNRPERIKNLVTINYQYLQMSRPIPTGKVDISELPFMPEKQDMSTSNPSQAIVE